MVATAAEQLSPAAPTRRHRYRDEYPVAPDPGKAATMRHDPLSPATVDVRLGSGNSSSSSNGENAHGDHSPAATATTAAGRGAFLLADVLYTPAGAVEGGGNAPPSWQHRPSSPQQRCRLCGSY
ncbi:hypothetical protein Q4I30_001667 [Leishmania utingensis]|uniref:Uncharacterized protein n=1 Tax=Leishmania utingensis TaxID=653362 RepID=A0AAW3AX41_9TRYP